MNQGGDFRKGVSIAFKLGTEVVVATLLGTLMGYVLDRFLGTRPWFFIIGVIFGAAAGCLNLYRAAMEMNNTTDDTGNPDNPTGG